MDRPRQTQLRQIHDYIAQDSVFYAKRVSEGLIRKTISLDDLPHLGRMVPELNEEKVRELALYSAGFCTKSKPHTLKFWPLSTNAVMCELMKFRINSQAFKVGRSQKNIVFNRTNPHA